MTAALTGLQLPADYAEHDPAAPLAATDARTGSEEWFAGLLRRLFAMVPRATATDWPVDVSAFAQTLERRARRRHAHFDLYLRESPTGHVEDLALVLRAQQGHSAAVTEIVRRVQPVIVARIHAMQLERDRDELVHDVLARVWEKIGTYRGQASLRTWCGHVTHNYLVNWIRNNTSRLQRERPLSQKLDDGTHDMPSADAPAIDDLIGQERARQVVMLAGDLAALAQVTLTPAEWELIQQVVIDGTPYDAIAFRQGVKPATLRVRLFRAIAKLRTAALQTHGPSYGEAVLEALVRE